MQHVLEDTKNGKVVDWKEHKLKTYDLVSSYDRIGLENKSLRVRQCGEYLEFRVFEDCTKKLNKAKFCQVRLCPMCAWRRSMKIFAQVSKVMNRMDEFIDYAYIFVTLTVRNVPGDSLSDEMDKLFKAFNLLTKRKEFKAISKGWFRCLEVTHNWQRNDYHPHFHVVIAVNKSYFTESKLYLSHEKWIKLWKSCLDVDYDPYVFIETVKKNKDGGYGKAVAEVAKYTAKPNDYLMEFDKKTKNMMNQCEELKIKLEEYARKMTDEAVWYMDRCLSNRRLIAFGGVLRQIHKELNLDDAVDGDLVNTGLDDEIRQDLNYILVSYRWNVGYKDYIMVQK